MAMCDYSLFCNFPKCRTKLSGFAWVTACSHIFCDQHGSGEFSRAPAICPACSSALSGKLDIVRTELAPSEQYKSMVLVGLRPETILDISHRALTFWTYQRLEEYKQKYSDVSELLIKKNKKYQSLQDIFDTLKLRMMRAGNKDVIENAPHSFTTGLFNQQSPHNSPPFLAVGPEGDGLFYSVEPESIRNFFQFRSPPREKSHPFLKKN